MVQARRQFHFVPFCLIFLSACATLSDQIGGLA